MLCQDCLKFVIITSAIAAAAILLDVMMPKKDGFYVCREIRKKSNVPIIMVTARGEDFERIMGLDIGADDYIVKTFPGDEVMAHVRAVLRRLGRAPQNSLEHFHMITLLYKRHGTGTA